MRMSLRGLRRSPNDTFRMDLRRFLVFGVLAFASLVVGHEFNRNHPTVDGYRIASYCLAGGVVVFGVLATRALAREITLATQRNAGGAVAPLRVLIQVVGYLIVLFAFLDVLQINLSDFLVGGAVTGVVIGIAAQQSLGNFFAGLVLLLARPYTAGDTVTIFSGAINGPHQGLVTDIGLLYTTVTAAAGVLKIPNSVLLSSAVSPGPWLVPVVEPAPTDAAPGQPTGPAEPTPPPV